MADIVLHFTNRLGRKATAIVRPPVVIKFEDRGERKKVVVRASNNVKAIHLSAGPVPNSEPGLPPGLTVEPDVEVTESVVAAAVGGTDTVALAASPPPPPPDEPPPEIGVCYEIDGEVFCW
jgi:hypothetical protein